MIKSGQTKDTDVVSQFLSATTDAEGCFQFSQVRPGKDKRVKRHDAANDFDHA